MRQNCLERNPQSYVLFVYLCAPMKRRVFPIFERVEITAASSEGKSLARIDNRVVFVQNAVPGDVADLRITRQHRRYLEAEAIHFHSQSDKRTDPACSHFGTCGGCKWQHLDYAWQLHYKQQMVIDALTRIGKIQLPDITPILGSKEIYNYRNRLDYSFSNKRWLTQEEIGMGTEPLVRDALGFHIPGAFDKILDLQHCYLQAEPSDSIRAFVRAYAAKKQLPFFDIREKKGFLRTLTIRTSSTGEIMVIFQFFRNEPNLIESLLEAVVKAFPQITSLLYIINEKANDTFYDQQIHLYHGRDHIYEAMENLRFKIGPKSFYQTNSAQAYELYKITRDFAGLKSHETVYDLYTGTGTIALFVAAQVKKMIGVELVETAIADAQINAKLNNIGNTAFFAADMKDLFTPDFLSQHGQPNVIITDPPRAGMHEKVTRCISTSGAERIVYVSCNPASQARDLEILNQHYQVTRMQAVDMFPQTHHVENVVLLEKR
jgi:23S rRNA (uracil1939-C5)-methyltransferase